MDALQNGNKSLAELMDDLQQCIIEIGTIKQAAKDVKLTYHALDLHKNSAVKTHRNYHMILESRQDAFDLAFSNLLELI